MRPELIGLSWPSKSQVDDWSDRARDVVEQAEKGVKDAVSTIGDKIRDSASTAVQTGRETAKEQLEKLGRELGEDVGAGAGTSLKKSFVPWIVVGGVVAVGAFVALQGRR